jgi:hypothetical protein
MTNIKEEVENEIREIWKILLKTMDYYRCAYYLHNGNSPEESNYLQRSRPFKFIAHGLWSLTIIEITKLFSASDSHRYNVPKFIDKIAADGHFRKLKFSPASTTKWQGSIDGLQSKIKDVTTLRDKIYAHSDRVRPSIDEIDLSFGDIQQLLDIGQAIVKEVYLTILGAETSMDSPFFGQEELNFIQILVKEKQDRIQAILAKK